MMNLHVARGQPTATSKQASQRLNGQRIELLASSSDGVEGSCSSSSHSCGSINDTICLHQKHLQLNHNTAGQQYVNADGSIFTLTSNNQCSRPANVARHSTSGHLQQSASIMGDSSPPNSSSSAAHMEPVDSKQTNDAQQRQQHRRLQYQVHQQLQRIYGNQAEHQAHMFKQNNQPLEKHKFLLRRHQLNHHPHHHQPQKLGINQVQAYNLVNETRPSEYGQRKTQIRSAVFKNDNSLLINHQPPMQHSHHLRQQQHHEQTYDSLTHTDISKDHNNNNNNNHNSNNSEDFYDVAGNLGVRQPVSINAIPEECDSFEDDEGELLLPEVAPATNKRAVIDCKSQLESLHYATATAAALLSATANAAAAFVATEKQFEAASHANGERGRICCEPSERSNQVSRSAIYSDTYQYVRKPRCVSEPRHLNIAAAVAAAAAANRNQQQNYHRNPIYANAAEPSNFVGSQQQQHEMRPKISNSASIGPIYYPIAAGNLTATQQHQELQQHFIHAPPPPQKCAILQNFSRQALPPAPNNNRVAVMNQSANIQAAHLIRLQQQQQHNHQQQHPRPFLQRLYAPPIVQATQAAVPTQLPALALVHQSGKNGPELIGKVLINNAASNQQVVPNALEFARYVQTKAALGNKKAQTQAAHHQVAYVGQQRNRIYGVPGPIVSVPAPSESSGTSNLPLVINRQLKPLGCIERICRIDLTLFWWSLLLVSLAFIGASLTITRYIV